MSETPQDLNVRWKVVDKSGATIWGGMYRYRNALDEAQTLNLAGLVEFAPYRVEQDRSAS